MQHTDSSYDVVIAGYGPTGAVLAKLLGRSGLHVLVVDRLDEIYDKPRAIGMDHEALRVLQFCGIAHELLPHTRTYRGGIWLGMDGEIVREFAPAPRPWPLGLPRNVTFVQPQFEAMLRGSVAREAAVEVALRTELVDFEQDAERVRITLRRLQDDSVRTVSARWLVGADGASSTVRVRLGGTIEDLETDEWWVVVDALRTGEVDFGERNVQFCDPRQPGTYVPGPGRLRRWEFRVMPGESPETYRDPQRVLDLLRVRGVRTDALELWRSAVYRFHGLVLDQWRVGRVFLAGDAAHQTPPHLGQGMVSGLRDAANLAWKLLHVEAGAPHALLDTYMAERRPHIRTLVAHAKAFGDAIGELDPERARERDRVLRAKLAARERMEMRQDLIPPLSTGLLDLDADGRPAGLAGQLCPQPRVLASGGGEVLLDDDGRQRFQLLTVGDGPQDWLSTESAATWHALDGERLAIRSAPGGPGAGSDGSRSDGTAPCRVHRLVETDGRFADWMRERGCTALIARPDRYVYGACADAAGLNRMIADLGRALRPPGAGTLAFAGTR